MQGNFAHGSYLKGELGLKRREAFENFISRQPPSYFTELAEDIKFDKDEEDFRDESDLKTTALEFVTSKAITTRGQYVKNKGWFSLHSGLRALIAQWTIVRESIQSMLEVWRNHHQKT